MHFDLSKGNQINRVTLLRERDQLVEAERKRRAGLLDEAAGICRSLLTQHPTYLGALQTLGLISIAQANFRQAITCFTTAAAEAPSDKTNFINLAVAWMGLELVEMAAVPLREATRLDPDDPEIHLIWGDIHSRNRDYGRAVESYERAAGSKSDLAVFRLCESYIEAGFPEMAAPRLLELHKSRPDWLAVVNLLHHLPAGMVDIDFEKTIVRTKAQKGETKREFKRHRAFVQGAILDRLGKYDSAWEQILSANEMSRTEFREQIRIAEALPPTPNIVDSGAVKSKRSSNPTSSRCPLFILGPSRSGKTTLELLIAGHEAIKRGYENDLVGRAIARASQISGLQTLKTLVLPEISASFTKVYMASLPLENSQTVFTTTNPGLISQVDALAKALPSAKFIFMRRDRHDLALRIFMKNYKRGNYFSYDLQSIYRYIDWYEQLTENFLEVSKNNNLVVNYEELVKNPEITTKRIFKFCNISSNLLDLSSVYSDVGAAEPYMKKMGVLQI